MPSDWETTCDAIASDLTTNVTALATATVHKYAPWDPEELQPTGAINLSVFPVAEAEDAEPLDVSTHLLRQRYAILVWEDSRQEGERLARDEAAAKTFLQLHNDVRTRVYANQQWNASMRSWYAGAILGDRAGRVRWFQVLVEVLRPRALT